MWRRRAHRLAFVLLSRRSKERPRMGSPAQHGDPGTRIHCGTMVASLLGTASRRSGTVCWARGRRSRTTSSSISPKPRASRFSPPMDRADGHRPAVHRRHFGVRPRGGVRRFLRSPAASDRQRAGAHGGVHLRRVRPRDARDASPRHPTLRRPQPCPPAPSCEPPAAVTVSSGGPNSPDRF